MPINERFSKMVVMPIPVVGEYTSLTVTPIINTGDIIIDDPNNVADLSIQTTDIINASTINTINASISNLWINGNLFSYNINTDNISLNSASITDACIYNISGKNAFFFSFYFKRLC